MNEASSDKIVIIGLDGLDPDLLDRFIGEGILPNFKRLIDNGAYGRLRASIPIITPVSWTSFITGKNPGKHGIFGFVKFKGNSYDLKILNSSDRKAEGIWSILNRYGRTVGILNLPSLYPPEKINKFMVCGMLTPNKRCSFTYPPELQEEFLGEVKDYEIDVRLIKAAYDSKEILLKDLYSLTDKRHEATRYLLKKYPCDVFITVFTETDRIQHYFFDDDKALRDYFKYLDGKLGNLLADLDKGTNVFVVSDHGIGPFGKFIYLNKWLNDQGLLEINKKSVNYLKHSFAKKIIQWISTLLVRLKFDVEKIKLMFPEKVVNGFTYLYCYYGGIDWHKTKAYFCSGAGEGIIINAKRRFPEGIVGDEEYESLRDMIIKGLFQIKDSDTGQSVVESAYKREDLLHGEVTQEAPDIILKLRNGYATHESVETQEVLQDRPAKEILVAEHRLEGIFIAYGNKIKSGVKIQDCSILDIAPTLLRKLRLPIPQDFDGRVLEEIFSEKSADLIEAPMISISEQLRKRIRELKLSGKIK